MERIDELVWALAGGTSSGLGTGGMVTKLQAAELAGRSGIETVIAPGAMPDVLAQIIRGESVGTRFRAITTQVESRKRWLISEKAQGVLLVDAGAAERLRNGGASLLPVGMIGVEGDFERGAPVYIAAQDGRPFALGLSNYMSDEALKLLKVKSADIVETLGYSSGDEMVHRDNMVLL